MIVFCQYNFCFSKYNTQQIFVFNISSIFISSFQALIVFTMNLFPKSYTQFQKFWIFIGFQWVMFFVNYVIRAVIPDIPWEIEVQKQRQDFVNKKLIIGEADEDLVAINPADD